MKRLFYIFPALLALLSLSSCGEYFVMGGEPDPWDGVTMSALCDGSCVMVGDSLPLRAQFTPTNPENTSVYWATEDSCVFLMDDMAIARYVGYADIVGVSANGGLKDTCRVQTIDRWDDNGLQFNGIYDMVVYARITIDGQPWDPDKQVIGAFVDDKLAGMAHLRNAFDRDYVLFRIWGNEQDYGRNILFFCYDRTIFRMYEADIRCEFTPESTLGTLSKLYTINFTRPTTN